MDSVIAEAPIAKQPNARIPLRGVLAAAMAFVFALHVALLVVLQPHAVAASRYATAALVFFAATCVWLRATRVPSPRTRYAPLVERGNISVGCCASCRNPPWANQLLRAIWRSIASDLIYVVAAFPLLLALSTTRETEAHRSIFLLNCGQMALAIFLTYVLLFRTRMTPQTASTVMGSIYAAVCGLLVLLTTLRFLALTSREERRVIGVDPRLSRRLSAHRSGHGLRNASLESPRGKVLRFVVERSLSSSPRPSPSTSHWIENRPRSPAHPSRNRMLVGTLSPLLITMGVFALAASVTAQFPVLALASIFLLLVVQGLEAGVLQRKYLTGQTQLIDRERDLWEANCGLGEIVATGSLDQYREPQTV